MKRLALIVTAACAALVSAAAIVGSTGAQEPAPPTGTLELVSIDREARFKFVDNPPRRRESAGDTLLISGRLRNSSNRRAGRFHASFTAVPSRRFVGQGSATFALGDGQIVVAGVIDERNRNDRTDTLAIVGGSGAYTGATGTMVTTEGRRRTTFLFTFAG